MRYFPSAARQRFAAACVVGVVSLGVLATPFGFADDDLDDQKREVEGQIDRASDALQEASAAAVRATRRLDSAKAKLSDARTRLSNVSDRLVTAQARDEQLKVDLAAAEARLEVARDEVREGEVAVLEQRGEVTSTIRDIYTKGDPQLLAVSSFLKAETPEDLALREAGESAIVNNDTRAYDDLRVVEAELKEREAEVAAATAEVADQKEEAAALVVETQALVDEAEATRIQVADLVTSSRQAREKAFSARRADKAVLQRLEQKEERIRDRILAASRTASGGGGSTYSGSTDAFLGAPVSGYVTSPYGYRTHPIYGYYSLHDGTDFGAGCGTALRASAGGTVVSKYYSESYGNRLFINVGQVNGKTMTLVYNHATNYNVSVGQRVERGDVVGAVGSTGWSTGCHLHFTVLMNGDSVDPMNFL